MIRIARPRRFSRVAESANQVNHEQEHSSIGVSRPPIAQKQTNGEAKVMARNSSPSTLVGYALRAIVISVQAVSSAATTL